MKIAIIPARGGSKRVKNKNIIDFFGKPMIAYVLEAAKGSGLFDKIHVSTESEVIRSTVEDLGFKVDFLRPRELADDTTGLVPVLEWVLKEYERKGLIYKDICCLLPTAPLLEPEDLKEAYNLYAAHGKKYSLHAVAKFPVPIEWAFRREENGMLAPVSPKALTARSQDLPKAYYDAGAFSYFPSSYLRGDASASNQFISYVIPSDKSVDIDDPEDLELAKILYLGRLAQKEMAR